MLDKKYWNTFYQKHRKKNEQPSAFCIFVLDTLPQYTQNKLLILDAGCGNGRDTYAFAKDGHNVCGIDSCGHLPPDAQHVHFATDDFTVHMKQRYDLIYSRFTFHSINDEQQESFLASIQQPNTFLCIETRSDKGINTKRIHGDTHYRNFTNIDTLQAQLKAHHFDILFLYEGQDVAVYKDENPVCIRVIAQKKIE